MSTYAKMLGMVLFVFSFIFINILDLGKKPVESFRCWRGIQILVQNFSF